MFLLLSSSLMQKQITPAFSFVAVGKQVMEQGSVSPVSSPSCSARHDTEQLKTGLELNEQACSTFFPSRHIKTPLWGFTSSGSGEVWIEAGRASQECVQRAIIIPCAFWSETWCSHLCVMPVTLYILSFSREPGTGAAMGTNPAWSSRRGRAAEAVLSVPAVLTGRGGPGFSAAALPRLDPRLCHCSAAPLQLGLEWLPVSRSFWNISLYQCAVKGKGSCTGLRL